jgi:hypothetical protein
VKKLVIIIFVSLFLLSVAGCQSVPNEVNKTLTSTEASKTSGLNGGGDPDPAIMIRNLEQLKEMRKMAVLKDEEQLALYLRSVEGGGARNREDLTNFLNLIDSLPVLKIIEGSIVWIYYQTGNSRDTGAPYDVVYVSTEAENGNWTRAEYFLSIKDVSKEMERLKAEGLFDASTLKNPIQSKNEHLKVYCENRYKSASDKDDTIDWFLDVNGIFTRVVYYTNDAKNVITQDVFDNIQISKVSEK